MKKLVAGIVIALVGCVFIPAWVDAQPRDGGRGRGRGIAEQDYRGQRRAYRGRQQRRRYHGGRWEWYEDVPSKAVGGFLGGLVGGWLSGQGRQAEAPTEAPEPATDEAVLEPWSPGWIAYCKRKYRSFDIKDGRYLSHDGNRYFCKTDSEDQMLQTPTRHTKALLDLADYFERLDPADYDQTKWDHCICGHCNRRAYRRTDDAESAASELGLTDDEAGRLFRISAGRESVFFMGLFSHTRLPTNQDAARCLRHMAVTGELPASW